MKTTKTLPTSFSLDASLVKGLKAKSYALSLKNGKRVTISEIVTKALLQYGIKPLDD